MDALELKAEPREIAGRRVKYLRQEGLVPAVMYGKDQAPVSLQIDEKTLGKVLVVAGSHQLISLQIGDKEPLLTMAREVQRDVIRRNYLHVDFYVVKMDEKVNANVPLLMVGESPAVKDLGGILMQGLDQLEVECLPSDLISSIEIDVSVLAELFDSISVADLVIPDTVTVLSDAVSLVARVEPPRVVEEEEEEVEDLEGIVDVEPEVLTASRREEEEEE